MKRTSILVALTAILLAPSMAGADKEKAKEHYREGQKLFNLGKFQEASVAFETAYQLHDAPALLFNLAQCHRQLGNTDRALFFYRGFLRNVPDTPNRADVEKIIQDLERSRGGGAPPPMPPPKPAEPVTPLPAPVPPPPAPAPAPAPVVKPPSPPPPPAPAPKPAAPPAAPTPAPQAASQRTEAAVEVTAPGEAPPGWQKWAAYGVIGAGVAVVGVGVMFGLQANQADEDIQNADVFSEELQDSYDSRKSRGKIAPILMGVGSAAVVGGGIWAYLLHNRSSSEPSAGLELDVSDGLRVGYSKSF